MTDERLLFTANTANIEQAHQAVLTHYGTLDGHTIELFQDGFDHIVYVVDSRDAFRFPKNQEYANKMPVVSRFLEEFAPLSPIVVPVSKVFSDHNITYEKYPFLPGKPLMEKLAGTFSERSLKDISATIGEFLTTLHSFPVTRAVNVGVSNDSPFDEWKRRYTAVEQHVFPLLDETDAAWIDSLFTNFFAILSQHEPEQTVIHFDIKPDHIIVDPSAQTLSGIIDFGDMRIGDPAYDFTYFSRYTHDLTGHVLKTYRRKKDVQFMERVAFYQVTLPIMDLVHAAEIGANEKIESLRHVLELSIANSRS